MIHRHHLLNKKIYKNYDNFILPVLIFKINIIILELKKLIIIISKFNCSIQNKNICESLNGTKNVYNNSNRFICWRKY